MVSLLTLQFSRVARSLAQYNDVAISWVTDSQLQLPLDRPNLVEVERLENDADRRDNLNVCVALHCSGQKVILVVIVNIIHVLLTAINPMILSERLVSSSGHDARPLFVSRGTNSLAVTSDRALGLIEFVLGQIDDITKNLNCR